MENKKAEILIADDDRLIVNLLRTRCVHLGLSVQTTHDALQALVDINRRLPSLVILDIKMPSGNGLSVCEMMASDKRLKHIPVIILTGYSDEDTKARIGDLGAHYVLKAPDIWRQIEALLIRLLDIESPGSQDRHRSVA